MSPASDPVISIPARLTIAELARAIGRAVEEIESVLPTDHASDLLSPSESIPAAKALGVEVAVEHRDQALERLYEVELGGQAEVADLPRRAARMVEGVLDEREDLDHQIEAASEHWSVSRMPVVDRSILRLGLWELHHDAETPTAVIVNEAVRLAKTYSTERSGSFVNGVLAALARLVRH